jgi:hypothetical protein
MKLSQEILDKVEEALRLWGNDNAEQMRILLRQRLKGKNTESLLAQSIKANDPVVSEDKVTMKIDLNDYWVYVDLGVKGLRNKSGPTTGSVPTKTYTNDEFPQGFKFKNTYTPPQMISNLQDYIARQGIQARVNKSQGASEVILDSFQMAEQMALAIKMKGIDGTKFYTDTFTDQSYAELTNTLSQIIGQEVEFQLITEFKK